ncbi:radical SAM additional 4Fe4S-binding SPASM domain-containing protein [Desulfonispora thiosulfatigenes DSM 11270]|uniref:Radical SAM additional 4Fe4S-binding SPASM domain-containing protein n=1 Tax=Desulfonispora thiosulfatigenes DSM 11270 TaxID=656914 RepID=A0A1W1UCI6_DESTI|nr:radical SAM/SPASM domain-containing protein [Desulfonispora thiosulfatigenes]SMB78779.1 radical SAM additional 4Fe4S-binding SPASM domain-containing protein [Desulfonispora thiosulfatigenes DSM 11270]
MKKFKRIYLEITNICNLKCSFCPPTNRKQEYITIDNFKKILNQINKYTDYLYFHVKGEPLLHPELEQLLKISDNEGFKVNLTTNGTLIEKTGDILLNSPALRQISFSLQSCENNNLNEKEKYIKDILDFMHRAVKETDLIIELRLWNLNNSNNVENKSSKNDFMLNYIQSSLNLPFKIEEKVTPGKGIKLVNSIYLSQETKFTWPNLGINDISEKGFCYGLRSQIAILVDGTVVPCCLDSDGVINLGNIYEKKFTEIINNKRSLNMVNGFSQREVVEPLCKKCGYRKRFEKLTK